MTTDESFDEIWKRLRRYVVRRGARASLDQLAASDLCGGWDLAGCLDDERVSSAAPVLTPAGHPRRPGSLACEEALALRVLDRWVGGTDQPFALAAVISEFGEAIGTMAMDSDMPGSGQTTTAYQLDGRIYEVHSDVGLIGAHTDLASVLAGWVSLPFADIHCRLQREGDLGRLMVAETPWVGHEVRINGRWFKVAVDGSVTAISAFLIGRTR